MEKPKPSPKWPHIKKYKVKIEVEDLQKDKPRIDVVSGVTRIDVSRNGDLLLHHGENFPTVGYRVGAWNEYSIIFDEEVE
jgi:hypothetical protein